MSKLHISTPELDERNLSYEEFFRIIHVILQHTTYYLRQIHPDKSINNIESYPLIIVEKIVKISSTLHTVVSFNKDYVVSNILIRSLADVISSLSLIYCEDDIEIKKLRHFLFIMDGLKGRINSLPEDLEHNGKIKDAEYEKLRVQIRDAIENYSGGYECAKDEIEKLNIYKTNKDCIDNLICHHNWKFKELSEISHNYYSWKDLYEKTNFYLDSGFISLLSEYVHGLSTSNLIIDDGEEAFEPILSITSSMLGKVLKILNFLYPLDMHKIRPKLISALYDESFPKHYVESILREYINKQNKETQYS